MFSNLASKNPHAEDTENHRVSRYTLRLCRAHQRIQDAWRHCKGVLAMNEEKKLMDDPKQVEPYTKHMAIQVAAATNGSSRNSRGITVTMALTRVRNMRSSSNGCNSSSSSCYRGGQHKPYSGKATHHTVEDEDEVTKTPAGSLILTCYML